MPTAKPVKKTKSRLRAAREDANMTQAELAERVGVEQATISMLENEQIHRPSHDLVTRIARELNVAGETLFPVPESRR
jgi:transcriptional regulator with XRE-family HTH domain